MNRAIYSICTALMILSIITSCSSHTPGDAELLDEIDPLRSFYIDSVAGNDAADGSVETPWRTIDRVNEESLLPGDTVFFHRGQTFSGGLRLEESGESGNLITFDAYGTGTSPRLNGSVTVTDWTDCGGGIFSTEMQYVPGITGAGIVLADGLPLSFRVWDSDFLTSLGAETGVFTFEPTLEKSTIYIRLNSSASPATSQIAAGYYLIGVYGNGVSFIQLKNLIFSEYSCHGLSIKNSADISVSDCRAENIGGALLSINPVLYGGNGFEFTLDSARCSISDSIAESIFDSGFSPQVFESETATSDIRFDGCTALSCGFVGIEISVLNYNGSTDETLTDIIVSDCTIKDSGKGWSGIRYGTEGHGIRVKTDTGTGSISGVRIERTVIERCAGSGIFVAGNTGTVQIHRTKLDGNSGTGITCINMASDPAPALELSSSIISNHATGQGIYYSTVNGSGFKIKHTTFAHNALALYINSAGSGSTLENCIFYSQSSAYLYAAAVPDNASFDYNCYFENGGAIIGIGSVAWGNVHAFASDENLDEHSIGSNPEFVNTENDWHLKSISGCKNTGVPTSISEDFEGTSFDSGFPSRGAYE